MYGSVVGKNGSAAGPQEPLLPASSPRRRRSSRSSPSSGGGRGLERSKPSSRRRVAKQASKPVLTEIMEESGSQLASHHEHHSYMYTVLNPRSRQPTALLFKRLISTTIILNVLCFIISTEPNLPEYTRTIFKVTEGVTSCIFLAEYLARLITCTERRKYNKYGPIVGRLRFMLEPSLIIDALATFPFFIERATGWDLPTLTYLRVFRLLRILKTQGYARAMDAVYRVIYYNREILYVALLLCIFLVLVTAVLMYYLRPKNPKDAEDFSSIPATMYLSILMLTGQGGPGGTLPWYTKAIVVMTAVFSVAMFAIPASMLTWGFEAEAARLAARARRRQKRQRNNGSSCSSSSSSDDEQDGSTDTTDEEYQRIIAGEDDDEDTEDEKQQKLMQEFAKGDADGSGALTMTEFIKLGLAAPSAKVKAQHFAHAAAAATNESWEDRMSDLETKVDATNKKLDRILQILKDRKT